MSDVKCEVVKKIRVLSQYANKTKELNLVKWGNMDPTYDIRKWEDGKPGKGIALSLEETKALYESLGLEFLDVKSVRG